MTNRIYLNGRFLSHAMSGVERTAAETIRALDIAGGGFEYELLCPPGIAKPSWIKNIRFRNCGFLRGHLWEQLELPFYARGGHLISLCNTAPIFKRDQLVRLHDASVYAITESYSFLFRLWYRMMFRGLAIFAKHIVTDSNFSRNELMRWCGVRADKITTVYLGVDHVHRIKSDDRIYSRHGIGKRPYVLMAGSRNRHKNLAGFLRSLPYLTKTDLDVVVCGGANSKVFAETELDNSFPIIKTGHVSDEELQALYEKASCFVFPSLYEGFGLPPLEAMASGCPVVASSEASLPEICGDAALYCKARDPKDIADKINQVLSNADLRDRLIEKGRLHAHGFTWKRSASELVRILLQSRS